MLVFIKVSDDQSIEIFNGAKVQPDVDKLCQIAFRVTDFEAVRAHLAQNGYRIPVQTPLEQTKYANFCVSDFARGVGLQTQPGVGRAHAEAVVAHADEFLAALFDLDQDAPRTGVNGVLDQLLDGSRGAFYHFASGDLVGDFDGQLVDTIGHELQNCGMGRGFPRQPARARVRGVARQPRAQIVI